MSEYKFDNGGMNIFRRVDKAIADLTGDPLGVYPKKRKRSTKKSSRGKPKMQRINPCYPVTIIPKCNMFMPERLRVTFKCNNTFTLAAAAAQFGHALTIANSCYTPFNSGTVFAGPIVAVAAQEPAGFAELCNINLYQQFIVISSKIKVTCCPEVASDNLEMVLVPQPVDINSANFANIETAASSPFAVRKTCMALAGSTKDRTAVLKCNIADIRQENKLLYMGDPKNYGTYGAVPANADFYGIYYQILDQAVASNNIVFIVETEFYVELCKANNTEEL